MRVILRFPKFILAGLILVGAMLTGAIAQARSLEGRITSGQDAGLPKSSVIEVTLADVSLQDAAAVVIAKTTFRARSLPVDYKLRYNAGKLKPNMTHALQVTAGGELIYISTEHIPVTGAERRIDVRVSKVGDQAEQGPALWNDWRADRIRGVPVLKAQSSLTLGSDGNVTGNAGCNRMNGTLSIQGDNGLSFGPMATTRKMCEPQAMDQEAKFLDVLAKTKKFRIDAKHGTLHLLSSKGKTLAVLSRG